MNIDETMLDLERRMAERQRWQSMPLLIADQRAAKRNKTIRVRAVEMARTPRRRRPA